MSLCRWKRPAPCRIQASGHLHFTTLCKMPYILSLGEDPCTPAEGSLLDVSLEEGMDALDLEGLHRKFSYLG